MSRQSPVVLALPFLTFVLLCVYTSCQNAFRLAGSDAVFASCVPINQVRKAQMRTAAMSLPPQNPFAAKKVVIDSIDNIATRARVLNKAPNETLELAAIINVDCIKERGGSGDFLSSRIIADRLLSDDLSEQVFDYQTKDTVETIEAQAQADACIVGISHNREYENASVSLSTFNDPGLSQQSHLTALHAFTAYPYFYDASYGIDSTSTTLPQTLVAIIDSGVEYSHPDLINRIQTYELGAGQVGYGVDATTYGTNLVNYNPVDVSPEGHGTHVAGLALAQGGNAQGVVGAAPFRSRVMAVKVFQADGATTNAAIVANGLEFARVNDADVVNISLQQIIQGANTDTILQYKLQQLIEKNIVVVIAMGNGSASIPAARVDGTSLTVVPAIYAKDMAGVISVASVDVQPVNGQVALSKFSFWSPTYAEIAAYGALESQGAAFNGLFSTIPFSISGSAGYGYRAGTSMASPLVSAAAALTISIIRDRTGARPSAAEVERLLLAGSNKNASIASYVKDGNTLDFLSLFNQIARDYPQTVNPTYRQTLCPN